MISLLVKEIKDIYSQENFKRIFSYFKDAGIPQGFYHFIMTVPGAKTNWKFKHNLGYVPLDVIHTRTSGPGSVTFNYDYFDSQYIDVTTTDACTVRFFLGRGDR